MRKRHCQWGAFFALLFASQVSYLAGGTGYMRHESCSTLDGNRIHLEHFHGATLAVPLVMKVPNDVGAMQRTFSDFVEVRGLRCGDRIPCESAAKSTIRVLHVSHKHVLGEFVMEFRDGATYKGSFKVKTRKPDKKMICE